MLDDLGVLQAALAGQYDVERELGHGGMATVYRARDLRHARSVAIKVLNRELAAAIGPDRFLREIWISAQLQHPNILPLLDSGAAGPLLFYVMPLVEGESLRQRLARERQLPIGDALSLTREVADALDYAHAQGVLHRDIKPENILLSNGHAMVADFGLGKAIEAVGDSRLTETGAVLGTPTYMSPEQAMGGRDLDGRSDQYALACTLYEMLAGQPPFTGPTPITIVQQHLSAPPPSVIHLRPATSSAASDAIRRAMSKTPADRFASAKEFVRAAAGDVPTPVGEVVPIGMTAMPATDDFATIAMPGTADPSDGQGGDGRGVRSKKLLRMAVAAGVLVLAVAGWFLGEPLLNALRGRHQAPRGPKQWVLVADFDSTPRDQAVERAARSLTEVALGQSNLAAPVSREQIALALDHAGKPDTARITTDLARELAYRSSIKVVVAGDIQRIGESYAMTMRAVDADSGRTMLSISDRAAKSADFIPCMNRLGNRLRSALGERPAAIASTRPLYETSTPSFEAYQEFVAGEEEHRRGTDTNYRAHVRRALDLDPGFGSALVGLGRYFSNNDVRDSARICFGRALSPGMRLTPRDRLWVEGALAQFDDEPVAALAAFDRELAADSSDGEAWSARAISLGILGRYAEAISTSDRAMLMAGPWGLNEIDYSNRAILTTRAGDYAEARRSTAHLFLGERYFLESWIAMFQDQWARAESLASAGGTDKSFEDFRFSTSAERVCAAAARGRIANADRDLARLADIPAPHDMQLNLVRARDFLSAMRGQQPDSLPEFVVRGDAADLLLIRGLNAVHRGDLSLARKMALQVSQRSADARAVLGRLPELLKARIALAEGRWSEVVRVLARPAHHAYEEAEVAVPATQVEMRVVVAETFDHIGKPDSAATYYASALDPRLERVWGQIFVRALVHPLVLQRLVMAELHSGQVANARRDFDYLVKSCDQPDAEMSKLIVEARSALISSEAAAHSARR